MRKVLLAVALVVLAAPPVAADGGFTVEGTLAVGNPVSKAIGGLTEFLAPCDPSDPDLQGLDGFWIALPAEVTETAASMTSDGVDTDVWFYDANCSLLLGGESEAMATDLTANENGTVPADAAYAIVDLAVGANASFTFTAGGAPSAD